MIRYDAGWNVDRDAAVAPARLRSRAEEGSSSLVQEVRSRAVDRASLRAVAPDHEKGTELMGDDARRSTSSPRTARQLWSKVMQGGGAGSSRIGSTSVKACRLGSRQTREIVKHPDAYADIEFQPSGDS